MFIYLFIVVVCVWVKCGHTTVLRWRRSEGNSEVAFLFLLSHTSRDWTQVRKCVWQVLSPTETSHQAEKSCLFNNESYSNREKEQQQPLSHPKYNNFHYPCFCSEDQTIFWKTTAFVLNIHGYFLMYRYIILYAIIMNYYIAVWIIHIDVYTLIGLYII